MDTRMDTTCFFCDLLSDGARTIIETTYFFTVLDNFPINKGHTLIIPKRHSTDIFSLKTEEWEDLPSVVLKAKAYLDQEYHPEGYNIGVNCGTTAGQTIFHTHIHIIPRYIGDVPNPKGGIRNLKKPLVKYP